jgi:mRNA-degrading endonuclease toxin of MazEF toxin-antitoxin module
MSEVKCEQVTTIRKARIVEGPLGGPLSPGRMEQVERCILTALDIVL